jgi:O-antigen ligase
MVTSYFSELTLKNFLTGFKSSYVVVHGFTHLHNSYLQLLMSTGIISIPLLVTFFLFGMRLFHNSLYLFGLFGILGIYAVVEQFIFFGSGDFILAPLLYLSHALSSENQIPSLSRSR